MTYLTYIFSDLLTAISESLSDYILICYKIDLRITIESYTYFGTNTYIVKMIAIQGDLKREVFYEFDRINIYDDVRVELRKIYKEFYKICEMWYSYKSYWNC